VGNGQVTGGDRTKMSAVERTRTRTSSEIKEQCENMKKFVGHFFFFFSKKKTCAKRKMEIKKDG
jgi:hypothetical protein